MDKDTSHKHILTLIVVTYRIVIICVNVVPGKLKMDLLVRLSVLFFSFVQWMYYIVKWVLVTEEKAKSVPPSDEPLLKLSATALGQRIRERKVSFILIH